MDTMSTENRRGFALPVAVFALVIIGVIMTSGFFMARQESRIGVASENASVAFYLVEQGLNDLMADWNAPAFGAMADWTDTTVIRSYAGVGVVAARITKMTNYLYFVDAGSTVTRGGAILGGAGRRVGVTLRLNSADIDPPAALTTRGPTSIKGSAEVHGEDEIPAGWGSVCPASLENKPGILTDNAGQVSTSGGGTITGSPAVEENTEISDETFTKFGDLEWADLTAMADITLSGGTINGLQPDSTAAGACRTGQGFPENWGNPLNPDAACFDYYPIIYVNGDARIQSGGVGQGVLLVEGDLDLRGNFVFHGIVIVQGSMETQGSGNRIYGGVMAGNADFDAQSLVGGSVVTNSTCAVSRAILNNSSLTRARPLASRSWVDLSAVLGN